MTPKQGAFCLVYIETGNASEAYRQAYSAGKMKPATINRKAKELLDNGKIAARIAELQKAHQQRHAVTVDSLTDELAEDRKLARENEQASAAIAATILEEGRNSPADVVLLQDAGALGALAGEGVLDRLDDELLGRVDAKFRSPEGLWVGTSGRARTVIYNTEAIDPETDLPDSILGFTDPKWKGRIGWAPTNGSFQAFVTALRVQLGEEGARSWLKGVKANKPKAFSSNTPIVAAVEAGEIDVGFVNHYYLHRFLDERGEGFKARNYYYTGGDPGALVNVAGVGILRSSDHKAAARRFIDYMLGVEAQTYFATQTHEFPLAANVPSPEGVPSLQQLDPPDIDLSNLADLRGTLDLLRDVGILN